jgi:anti-anti-sigma factor
VPRIPQLNGGEPCLDMHVAWSVGHAVLTLRGELNTASAGEVADRMRDICSEGPIRLFVDLTDVTVLNGLVLGRIATVVGRLRENGCPLLFINPSGATRELMHRHGLQDLLQLDPA